MHGRLSGIIAALIILAQLTGCAGGESLWVYDSFTHLYINQYDDYVYAGKEVEWRAQWDGGVPPFTVYWDFGGLAGPVQQAEQMRPYLYSPDALDMWRPFDYAVVASVVPPASADGEPYEETISVRVVDDHGRELTAARDVTILPGK